LCASRLLRPDGYALAQEAARAFIELRPANALGHKVLAYASEHLGQTEAARESYRRALELAPEGLNGRILYAQFLGDHQDPNGAQTILKSLWQAGRSRELVAIALVNLRNDRKQYSPAIETLEEAVRSNPRNAYLWQQLAGCRMQTDGPAGAIEPLTRAVELYPERGPARGSLARLLEVVGKLDEAEMHLRALQEMEPENPVGCCLLAQFLARRRPEAAQEALAIAEKALTLPPNPSLPRGAVEKVIAEIRSRMESSVQK
jgi:predicted Zn-dependent protease